MLFYCYWSDYCQECLIDKGYSLKNVYHMEGELKKTGRN